MKRESKPLAAAEWAGKSMPANDRIEKAALAALLMLNLGALNQTCLTSEHFFTPANEIIFGAIASAEADGMPFDIISVTQAIHDAGQLEQAGGAKYIEALLITPEHNNAPQMLPEYCAELEKVRQQRGLWKTLDKGFTALRTAGSNAEEVAGEVKSGIDKVFQGASGDDSLTEKTCGDILKRIENIKKRQGKPLGLWVGVPAYDNQLGGLHPACMDIIGARPAVGKTSMIETMIDTLLDQSLSVSVFQKDMSVEIMLERIACRRAKVVFEDFFTGIATDAELHRVKMQVKRLAKLANLLRIYNPATLTAGQICTVVRRDKDRHGLSAWFLDHFQTIKVEQGNTVEGLTESSKRIRGLITNSGIPGVIVAQIGKEADKSPRPHSGQFKFCDQLFSDADRVALLWSLDDPKELDPNERQVIKFTIDKNRMGSVSDNDMLFHRELMTFESKI